MSRIALTAARVASKIQSNPGRQLSRHRPRSVHAEHRHRPYPDRRQRSQHPAAQRRRGDVPRQEGRPQQPPVLHARMNETASERLQMENPPRHLLYRSPAPLRIRPCISSRRSRPAAAASSASRPCCAGTTRSSAGLSPAPLHRHRQETGLIQPLGDWVIWETCRLTRNLRSQGLADVRVAINISAQQLRHDNLLLLIRGAMSCYDLSPADIELEITESTAMQNPEVTLSILDQLAAMGIRAGHRRFRHRLFLAVLPEASAHPSPEARPLLRQGHRNRPQRCRHLHRDHCPRPQPGPGTGRRRRGNPGPARLSGRLDCDVLQGYLFSKPACLSRKSSVTCSPGANG